MNDPCHYCLEPISRHSPTELVSCLADLRAQDDRTYYATPCGTCGHPWNIHVHVQRERQCTAGWMWDGEYGLIEGPNACTCTGWELNTMTRLAH